MPTPKKPDQFTAPSGDFLAFVEDVKRRDTKAFTVGDKTFHLRGPSLLTDDEAIALTGGGKSNVIDKARAVIDDYDGFVAAGGTAMLLMSFYDQMFPAKSVGEEPASSSS